MEKIISEVLLKKNKEIKMARVLLKFNLPTKKYPNSGVWCYLISSKSGIFLLDPGPKFIRGVPLLRKYSKETKNSEIILKALNKYFPDKTIRQILISHYHYDHSENAPDLQQKIKKKFGNTPLIRIHKKDAGLKKFLNFKYESIDRIYKRAGYKTYLIGTFIKDNEAIKGTDFKAIHLPGHTEGNIGLINHKDRIVICGLWFKEVENPIIDKIFKMTHEDEKKLQNSIKKIRLNKYKYYFLHTSL